jgi:hypothetical protein
LPWKSRGYPLRTDERTRRKKEEGGEEGKGEKRKRGVGADSGDDGETHPRHWEEKKEKND